MTVTTHSSSGIEHNPGQGHSVAGQAHLPGVRWRVSHIQSSVVTFADQILVSGCNFLSTALIARALGLAPFGWYTLIWLVVLLAGALQLGLIVSPMMSIGPKQGAVAADRYFSVLLVHEIVYCGMAVLGIWITVTLLTASAGTSTSVPVAAALAGGAYLAQDFARRLLFTRQRPRLVLMMDVVNQLSKLALIAWIWRVHALNIESALWIVGAAAIGSTLSVVVFLPTLRFDRADFWPTTVRQWRSARWLTGTGLMQWAGANSALIVTGSLLGPAAVGALRAAQTILGVLNISREAIENIVPQQAGRALARDGLPGLWAVLVKTAGLGLALGSVVVLALVLLGGKVLRFVYGPDFERYGFVIAWLSLTFLSALMILTFVCGFRALERTLPVFMATSAATIVNLALMYPAVKTFGVSGAIGVLLASDWLVVAILVVRMRAVFAQTLACVVAGKGSEGGTQ